MEKTKQPTRWLGFLAFLMMLAFILWDTRYMWSVHEVMHGWPMPWANLWYIGQREWSPLILVIDLAIWIAITVAAVVTAHELREVFQKRQLSLSQCLGMTFTVAALIGFYLAERAMALSPENDSIFPAYARREVLKQELWFDLGLFTASPGIFLPLRLLIIFGLGCVAYQIFRGLNLFVFKSFNLKLLKEESS